MSKFKVAAPPPKSLSEAIRMALVDLEKTEKDPRYEIDMSTYHEISLVCDVCDVCDVCFAGTVMAQTCKLPIDFDLCGSVAGTFGEIWGNYFYALNSIRAYQVAAAIATVAPGRARDAIEIEDKARTALFVAGLASPGGYYGYAEYGEDPVAFKQGMGVIADILEQEGL